jgi:hypothetical protein
MAARRRVAAAAEMSSTATAREVGTSAPSTTVGFTGGSSH